MARFLFSFSGGVVRGDGHEVLSVSGPGEDWRINCRMVRATNPAGQGDAGAPVVNKFGELVAVAESGGTSLQGVNLFIDVMQVRAFLNETKVWIKEDESPPPKAGGSNAGMDRRHVAPDRGPETPGKPATNASADEKAAAQHLARAKLFGEG